MPPPKIATAQGWQDRRLREVPLYTFCGYEEELRDDDIFQNFVVERQRYENPNPVSHLWADAYKGSWIMARVDETGGPHLSATFENGPESWPCGFAIRPIGEKAVATGDRENIQFDAEVVPDSAEAAMGASVSIASPACARARAPGRTPSPSGRVDRTVMSHSSRTRITARLRSVRRTGRPTPTRGTTGFAR
jgi:hypothetical protein